MRFVINSGKYSFINSFKNL